MKQALARLGYFLLSSAAHLEAPDVETSLLTHLQCPYPTEEMDKARRREESVSVCRIARKGEEIRLCDRSEESGTQNHMHVIVSWLAGHSSRTS
jgi:hypothetical protein